MNQQKNAEKSFELILNMLREKSEDGKNAIKIRDVIHQNNSDEAGSLKQLFSLLEDGKIILTTNRRDKDEPYICYVEDEKKIKKTDTYNSIRKIIDLFTLYHIFTDNPSLCEFHFLSANKYAHHEIFKFSQQITASFTETRILLNAINGFISGLHPVHLNDMNLSPHELAYYTEKFLAKNNSLIENELIKIQTEYDGITCRISVAKSALKLIQNMPPNLEFKEQKRQAGLYVHKPLGSIKETKMYYNQSESRLFDNVTKLLNKSDKIADINITLLLHGPSGTGKTEFAYQMAKKINADIMQFDFSQIQSKWVGETEKNIKSIFNEYKEQIHQTKKPIILLMNEADGLMNKRVGVNTSNDIHSNLAQAQMLEALEEFKGVLVATTNMYQNIDVAFHRRFLFKYKIDLPDASTKKALLKDSFISEFIDQATIKNIINSRWSPAQLRNLEQKIEQFELLNELNENLILEMLTEEGLLNVSKLGY